MNYYEEKGDFLKYLRKTMRIMRLSLFLIVISTAMAFSANSYSQSAKFSMEMNNVTVKEVIKAIENQSEFLFFYQEKHVDLSRQVTIHVNEKDVETILDQLFAGTDNIYVINDRQIVLGVAPRKELDRQILNFKENVKPVIDQPQQKEITGKVTDTGGLPLPGVSVIVKGTTIGTVTNADGNFSLTIPNDAEALQISFVGMKTQEIAIEGRSIFTTVMEEEALGIDEVVVVGYGVQQKVNLTGAVSAIKGDELVNKSSTGSIEAMQGLLPGTTITRNSGSPGEEGYNIQIRGITSVHNNPVLVLIDGIEGDLATVRPEDIESISVLKDAAAASIYGSKAAGGVLLVTTKKGKAGALTVNFNSYLTMSKFARLPERMSTWQQAELVNLAYVNAGRSPVVSESDIAILKDPNRDLWIENPSKPNTFLYYGDWDYTKLALHEFNYLQSHNLAISGGSENTTFRLSGTYYNNDGILKIGYDSNTKYSGIANIENKLGKYLKLSSVVSYANNIVEKPARGDLEGQWRLFEEVFIRTGATPLRDPNGNLTGGDRLGSWDTRHKLSDYSYEAGLQKNDNSNLRLNSFLTIDNLVKGLQFRIVGAIDANFNNALRYQNPVYNYLMDGTRSGSHFGGNSIYKSNYKSRYQEFQFLTDYDVKLNNHNFHFLGGYSATDFRAESFSAEAKDKVNKDLQDFNWASSSGIALGDNVVTRATQSFFGRINYNYNNRYLFEANVRYDGSSKLNPNDRYQFFPSFSAGWRMEEENWFNVPVVSQLKFRGSWGQLGNQGVLGNYSYIGLLNPGNTLILGTGEDRAQYYWEQTLASRNITWETIETSNIGLDFGFFDNKLTITGDYFIKRNKNMLAAISYPSVIGIGLPLFNVGEMKTWGWETNVGWRSNSTDFGYWINANIADAQNELVEYLGADVIRPGTNRLLTGYPINSIFGYKSEGFFQSKEEVEGHAFQNNATGPGDVKFVDLNGDGFINSGNQTVEDHGDLVYLGNTSPRYTFGLQSGINYKNIDFSFFFQGVGERVAMLTHTLFPFIGGGRNTHMGHLNYWTEDNPNAFWPRPYFNGRHNFEPSDRWVQNAAYVRLKDVQVGYTLPSVLLDRIGIQRLRFYLAGKDLWEYTNVLDYMDPEIPNQVVYQYPFSRRYTLGLNLTF